MNTQFNNLSLDHKAVIVNVVQQTLNWCEVCGSGYHVADAYETNLKSVNYMGNA